MALSKRKAAKTAKPVKAKSPRTSPRTLRSLANKLPVEALAALTGRSESTIRRALNQGPSKAMAADLLTLRREIFGGVRKPKKRKPASKKPAPKKPAAKKPVAKKPAIKKPVSAKPIPRKPVPKKPISKKRKKPAAKKPVPKKPVSKKRKKPTLKKPASKKPKKPKKPRRFPSFMRHSAEAEMLMMEKLLRLEEAILTINPELSTSVKSFINVDGTVDGELRLRDLPDEWRTIEGMPALTEAFSNGFRAVGAFPEKLPMGGAFWISCGLRFGPKDTVELEQIAKFYKRFRGLLQVGAYASSAQYLPAMLNNLMAIRMLVERVWVKRNLPPTQLLIRFTWTPTNERPGRWKGEEGLKE